MNDELLDNWHNLDYHPLALAFPPMTEEEYEGLVQSMVTNGYNKLNPIILIEDPDSGELSILDGRNRHTAAMDAGVVPSFETLGEAHDPTRYVIAANIERRMLTPGQRAAVASRLATLSPGVVPSESTPGTTQAEAAGMVGASVSGIKKFRQIEAANPEIAAAVERGVMSLEQGLNQARKTREVTHDVKEVAGKIADANHEIGTEDSPPAIPPSLQPDADEPTGSANMAFDSASNDLKAREVEYTAHFDVGSGKVMVRMGTMTNVYALRPDTAAALGEAILDAAIEGNSEVAERIQDEMKMGDTY